MAIGCAAVEERAGAVGMRAGTLPAGSDYSSLLPDEPLLSEDEAGTAFDSFDSDFLDGASLPSFFEAGLLSEASPLGPPVDFLRA